jgi:hypothetical protein
MATNLLYFPYIDLPETDWTLRSLLYYGKVASIIPQAYIEDPAKNYDPFMLELVNSGLVIPINPTNEIHRIHELNKPFMDFVQSPGYRIRQKQTIFKLATSANVRQTRISSQKFNSELLCELSHLGLSRSLEGHWYEVEYTTANYLMTYLASVLATKLEMLPVTDDLSNIRFMRQFRKINHNAGSKRDRLLQELVPYPTEIDLSKLQKFKVKHEAELNFFGTVIEEIALDPRYNDENLLNLKINELKQHRDFLIAKMRENHFGQIFFGAVCGIGSPAVGLVTSGTAGAISGGIIGLANAIYTATRIEKPENISDQTGMKYLALLDKRLKTRAAIRERSLLTV